MSKDAPVLLDLFGGRVGGGAWGYRRVGWRVVSVDIAPAQDNPADVIVRGDALDLLPDLIGQYRPAAIHASPPCQGVGALAKGSSPELSAKHPDYIPATRAALSSAGIPYVIENVAGSGVRKDLMLCGEMWGLGVIMHRWFELGGWGMPQPTHPRHRGRVRGWRHGEWHTGPYVACYGLGGGKATIAEMQDAKRIYWSSDHLGLRDALPPVYTELIGRHLLET